MKEQQVDAGAKALREHQMAGRMTVEWERVPKSQKKKWIVAAQIVIEAAENANGPSVVCTSACRGERGRSRCGHLDAAISVRDAGFAAGWNAAIDACAAKVAFREPITAKRFRAIPMPAGAQAEFARMTAQVMRDAVEGIPNCGACGAKETILERAEEIEKEAAK